MKTRENMKRHGRLAEELARLASLHKLDPNPVVEIDVFGRVMYLNPAATRLFTGLKKRGAEHPMLHGLKSLVDILTAPKAQTIHTREIAVGDKWFFQTFLYLPDVNRIRVYCQEDTARKETEQALADSENRYRRLFETAQDGILILDAKTGRIADVNPFLTRMLGYSHETFLGKKLWEIGPFKDIEASRSRFVKLQKEKYVRYEDLPIETFDGRQIQVEFVSNVYTVDHRKVIQCNIRDISERKQTQAILEKDNVDFEKLVSARTRELLKAHAQLEKAKRLSTVGMLAAIIAHELRNPLATVRIAVYNIRKKAPDARLEGHLTSIELMVEESNQIINNLLFYSRIKMPRRESLKIHDLLAECALVAAKRFEQQHASLSLDIKVLDGVFIEADPTQMKELFFNLINNAYEATVDRKGVIEISAELVNGSFLEIFFRDNGVGMIPADLERVREPFFSRKAKGTGLGLTVCFQIIDLHEGRIEIKSRKDKGTTVAVLLPVKIE